MANGKVDKKTTSNKKEVTSLVAKIKAKALENQKKLRESERNNSANSTEDEPNKTKHSKKEEEQDTYDESETFDSFQDLDLVPELIEACKNLNYSIPTPIQAKSIPPALKG